MPERRPARRQQLPLFVGSQRGPVTAARRKRWTCRLVLIALAILLLVYCFIGSRLPNKDQTGDDGYFQELTVARQAKIQPASPQRNNEGRIPKIVHFVYGLRDPEPTLDVVNYLAIKAAHDVIQPDQILFHYHYMPVGHYWEKVRPWLTLQQVPLVTEVMGRPVSHYAHRADVVRLEVLAKHGGIYLDMDLMMLKPVDHLLQNEFVMAQEGKGGSVGLCNAMIMARAGSSFLQRWYATYATFNSNDWNYHSVVLPGKLSHHFADELTVLDHTAFFWPLWDGNGLRTLYLEKSYDFSANLGTHIWESAARRHLMANISEEVVMNVDNSLYCQLRRFFFNGLPDPRPGACRILTHTERPDQLVGQWDLQQSSSNTNPARIDDASGNDLAGLVRDGSFSDGQGVKLTGRDSYIFLSVPIETTLDALSISWWMKTSSEKQGGTAVAVQTNDAKIYARTQSILSDVSDAGMRDPISLALSTTVIEDTDYAWHATPDKDTPAGPFPVNQDGAYHHYALIVNSRQPDIPALSLYMDGHVIASNSQWRLPPSLSTVVRGIWFGSAEPEHSNYQDPWDDAPSLDASFSQIRVWERALTSKEVRLEHTQGQQLFETFSNAPNQSYDGKDSELQSNGTLFESDPTETTSSSSVPDKGTQDTLEEDMEDDGEGDGEGDEDDVLIW